MASTVQEKEEMNHVKTVKGDGELNGDDKKMETNEVEPASVPCNDGDGDATNKEIVPEKEHEKDDGSNNQIMKQTGSETTMKEQWMMLTKENDPLLLYERSEIICENDYVILAFADGRQIFAQAVQRWRGKSPPVKINKRTYPTKNLIGLPYGTVLELRGNQLVPLPPEEDVIPSLQNLITTTTTTTDSTTAIATISDKGKSFSDEGITSQKNDNRNLLDNNTSQAIDQRQVESMREEGMDGQDIVATLIENSKTFDGKTDFSKAKYITKKQMKYQPRCRILRCTASTITEALFLKDHRRIMNLRVDTMAQILSYSNVCAGSRVFVFECPTMGLLTGALAQRMGGYGQILSIYSGQQPSFSDMLAKFNLSFPEQYSIKYIHSSQIFTDLIQESQKDDDEDEKDVELKEREQLKWPCPLQPHTRQYLETTMKTDEERTAFLAKRCARFARKLTRHTFMEANQWLLRTNDDRKCDSIIIATRYDPTYTLFKLLPYLETSCPFVVLCEFLEPFAECFRELQKQSLAINMRLTDTWLREYQILPGRTHPNMNMSQNGGFLLTGIKLCPSTGKNEMDEELVKEIRAQIGGRRGKKNKNKRGNNGESNNTNNNNNVNNSNGRSKKRNASKMKNCNDKNNNFHDSKRAK